MWLFELQERQGLFVGEGTGVAIAFSNQDKCSIEVLDQRIVSVSPKPIGLLKDREWIDKKLGVNVEDGVEPIVLARPADPEVSTRQHISSIRISSDRSKAPGIGTTRTRPLNRCDYFNTALVK